jgi:hypothetical protein
MRRRLQPGILDLGRLSRPKEVAVARKVLPQTAKRKLTRRVLPLALGIAAAAGLAACGGSSTSTTSGTTSAATTSGATTGAATTAAPPTTTNGLAANNPMTTKQLLTTNAAEKSATLVLDAAHGSANGGFNFDGYSKGALAFTMPTGWKVTVKCTNGSTSVSHSCAIVESAGSTTPAFAGAETPNPLTGLAPGASASFTFTPTKTGTYRIDCLVPGHDAAGMWATLKVVASGAPAVSTSGAGAGAN